MFPVRVGAVAGWSLRALLPIAVLAVAAILLSRLGIDRELTRPFFDPEIGDYPLREDWFFRGVLHWGGQALVGSSTVFLVARAWSARGVRRSPAQAGRCAYLATCLLVTIGLAAGWSAVVGVASPWHWIEFGGAAPSAAERGGTWLRTLGAPSVHVASGFAWVSLYFVGLSRKDEHRWLWVAPGILLGLLFAFGQHVRGEHAPSLALWSLALAWLVASGMAWLFRSRGWLEWADIEEGADPDESRIPLDPALPWLVGLALALAGAGFFAIDCASGQIEEHHPLLHTGVEVVEMIGTMLGPGIAGWLYIDRIGSLKAREARRVEEERAQRFQVLGRMAASVAHEVRNPLHTLRLVLEEQRIDLPDFRAHPMQRDLDACLERIERAVELVYRLARPEASQTESNSLTQAAQEAVASLERQSTDPVTFGWRFPPPDAWVGLSRASLGIVLDNLLRNAAEASPERGTVSLELAAAAGGWELRIQNAGSLHQPRRTMTRGPGLGLGVSISRQILSGAGGRLELEERNGLVHCTISIPGTSEPGR